MSRLFALLLTLACLPQAWAGDALDAALKQAAGRHQPVLVEFHAPWCYSCYYMARHVQTGSAWKALQQRAVVVQLDADSPEGALRMHAFRLKALPSYLLLDARGREMGRLLGERKREEFYGRIEALLDGASTLDDLSATAARGGKAGRAAALEALGAFHARRDAEGGIGWYYDLSGPVRRAYEQDPAVLQRLLRLRLMDATQRGDAPTCAAVAAPLLATELGCERPEELARLMACTADGLPAEERLGLLQAQRAPMEALVEQRVFGNGPACADERSAVLGLADLYDAVGAGEQRLPLLRRAADVLTARIGKTLSADRNRADNLRLYLEQAGDWKAYDALMPQLIATWPDDYVYPFRYGRSLLARDRASEALPYLERAASHAYGVNRLKVAEQQVKALKRLGRGEQATALADEVLEANGPWFAEDAARLRALR